MCDFLYTAEYRKIVGTKDVTSIGDFMNRQTSSTRAAARLYIVRSGIATGANRIAVEQTSKTRICLIRSSFSRYKAIQIPSISTILDAFLERVSHADQLRNEV